LTYVVIEKNWTLQKCGKNCSEQYQLKITKPFNAKFGKILDLPFSTVETV
jgi:hypothetical protein